MMKLYNSFNVAYNSVKSDKMMSAYMSEFVSFNILDKDYKKDEEVELETIVPNIFRKSRSFLLNIRLSLLRLP